jgi:hypothetical protein
MINISISLISSAIKKVTSLASLSAVWYDFSDRDYIDLGTGVAIEAVLDKTANNNDTAVQSTTSLQPQIVEIDGEDYAHFDIDELALPSALYNAAAGDVTAMFVAAKETYSTGIPEMVFCFGNSGDNMFYVEYGSTAGSITFKKNNTPFALSITGIDTTKRNLITCWSDDSNMYMRVNGGDVVTAAHGASITGVTAAYLGRAADSSSYQFIGDLGAFILRRDFLSDTQLTNLELQLVSTFKTYYPNAPWISEYTDFEQFLINQEEYNNQDSFKDTTRNKITFLVEPDISDKITLHSTDSAIKTLSASRDGAGYDFGQTTSTRRPTLDASINGLAVMQFDNELVSSNSTGLGDLSQGDFTIFFVCRNDATTTGDTCVFSIGTNESGGNYMFIGHSGANQVKSRCVGYLNIDSVDCSIPHVITMRRTGNTGYIRYNKNTAVTSPDIYTSPAAYDRCTIGASIRISSFHDGVIGKGLGYSESLSDTKVDDIIDELMLIYGIS